MKKIFVVFTAFALCLMLTACGKSDAVKEIEAMIEGLGEITADSGDELRAIEEAYAALPEEEKEDVGNYGRFGKAKDDYYECLIAGMWYPFQFDINNPKTIFEPNCSIELKSDGNVLVKGNEGSSNGSWHVENGNLVLEGVDRLYTEYRSFGLTATEREIRICENDGYMSLEFGSGEYTFVRFLHEDEYFAQASEIVRIVDFDEVNAADYLGFHSFRYYATDEWGGRTDNDYLRACLKNLIYEDGWMYIGGSDNFAVEVLIPDYTATYTYHDGGVNEDEMEARSVTVDNLIFNYHGAWLDLEWNTGSYSAKLDIGVEDLSIGRSRGELYFINSEYVEELVQEDLSRIVILTMDEEYELFNNYQIYSGFCEEDNPDY